MPIALKEEDEVSRPTPLAPENLARGYADIAMGYHRSLPELKMQIKELSERIDTVHGIAIASHGLHSRNASRIEDIAVKVNAGPRSFSSGSFAAVSVPPKPLEIRTRASQTGNHVVVDNDEIEKIKTKFAEMEAEKRGATEALQALQIEEDARIKRENNTRNRWAFVIMIVLGVGGFAGWALAHISIK